ncbi:unnamed protein product [Rotaria sordida]|uniref:Uncharacterized protein n=1 Tax=Rotaria sordida TaxID=392033 RepID=A0A814C3J8_9BILA|nr:unnamed protein product [Rotaria sordida]CAF0979996.1 unnamed protein product [Rotaria sordida]CAF1043260.1 unnamed protein product [Rotaria sordida]CAF1051166.1 unnamed protein product [Rotaria sordida]CAF3811661.1 unnamed protein product [Rotaria sordida]
MSDNSPSSSTDESINQKISSNTGKHIYFDEEHDDNENLTTQKIIERPTPSTIRFDSSDLITRCKDFLPLLSDTNQNSTNKNENISLEKDDELNFPDIDDNTLSEKSSKESGEASTTTTTDSEKQNEIIKKKRKKKKKKKKKKVKLNDDLNQDNHVNT